MFIKNDDLLKNNIQKYQILVAKTNKDNSQLWLPLWMHNLDCAETMVYLVNNWLADSVKESMQIEDDTLSATGFLLGYLHDIGKATSYFQALITKEHPTQKDMLNENDLNILDLHRYESGATPHAHAGQWILSSRFVNKNFDKSFVEIIGSHHGIPAQSDKNIGNRKINTHLLNFFGDYYQTQNWSNLWNPMTDDALSFAGFNATNEIPILSGRNQILLSGLLIMADWISSNPYYFPLIEIDSFGENINYQERISYALNTKLKFPDRWTSDTFFMDDECFEEKFGFLPNNMQKQFLDIINNAEHPGVYIIESTMGSGKTEAALAGVDVLSNHFGEDGVFWGMPTQVTSNGMFPRLLQWAEKENENEDLVHSIRLAHGASQFNTEYQNFAFVGKSNTEEDSKENGIVVHPWFEGNKKALLADYVIGTVDQFLLSVLKRKHFVLRHLGLVGKIVIIDECHAYDIYMSQYLDQAIKWMGAYGVPVILLSATLPKNRRKELVDAYCKSYIKCVMNKKFDPIIENQLWEENESYPLITWTDGNKINQKEIQNIANPKKVSVKKVNYEDLVDTVKTKTQDGGCAVLIFNTVRHAQDIYQKITESSAFDKEKIILYHSQFTFPDRQKKEQEILKYIGKKSNPESRNGTIVIGTQVLEQSLDYDADVMFSELCPIDLLFQRMGRLHRHERENRPNQLKKPELYIVYDENDIDKGSQEVYGEYLLWRTNQLLKSEFIIPNDISRYVQRVYDENDNLDINERKYQKSKQKFINQQEELKAKARAYLLQQPQKANSLACMLINNNNFVDDQHAEASVRAGNPSIEVLLMKKIDDVSCGSVDPALGLKVPVNIVPSSEEARKIAFQRIRLPQKFSMKFNMYNTINELEKSNKKYLFAWQASPWLKGELVLLLDENMHTELNGYDITYNQKKGLVCERKE